MGVKRNWFGRRPSDDEMREELEAHVAMRAEHDRVDEAAARRRLGNLLHTRESMRRVWIAEWWDALRQDAHFTWRSWRRRPAFALAAILVLGLGLGASTALFAALDRVLFRPLPYADPDRLVSVGWVDLRGGSLLFAGMAESMVNTFYVQEWSAPPAPFQSVTAMFALVPGIRNCQITEGQPEGLRCDLVEHNFLRVLGERVALGRDFAPEDDVRGAPPVVLISHALWVRRFGADPGVVDRTLTIERGSSLSQFHIVGVLPPDFEMPFETADILLPVQMRPLDPNSPFRTQITVLARLRPGVKPDRARLMMASQWPAPMKLPAGFSEEWRVRPVRDRRVGDAARVAWLLMGAVAIFLLIACVNVTNLMLARVAERQREFAVRAALGAGKLRLARLALAESLLLSLAAGGIGLLVAFALLQTFVAMAPPGIPGIANASIDVRAFAVAALLVVLTGTAIGVWPAVSVFRVGALHGLRSTTTSSSSARPRLRFALVTTQIALTLALLGGSALLLRSLWNVISVPLGFNAERVITVTARLSRVRYPTAERGAVFFEELLSRARAMPGTVSVALSDSSPPPRSSGAVLTGWEVEGRPVERNGPTIPIRSVTPHYFETFQIPVVRGRTFQEADWTGEPAVALNESAERMLFAGERAVGHRLRPGAPPAIGGGPVPRPWYTVVGVIADTRNGQALTDEPRPEIYFVARPGRWGGPLAALAAFTAPGGHLSLRTTARPVDAIAFLRQIAADLDPRQLVTIETGDQQFTLLTAQPRFIAWLLTAFAALALLLAAAGLYSVASYLVLQRRRDIGIRMAIGASPRDVARQVVGEAGRWIIGGALVGSALGWMGTRALQSQLYQVEALDLWSWTGALLALAVVLAMAVFGPAYRAAHVDPVTALRSE
jgi:putative ABC transport system permease protein